MIINGDCLEELDKLDENSIDAIVTDPPYGLTSITKRFGKEGSAPAKYGKDGSFARLSKGFMGKEWDGSGIEYNVEMWQKCLKVLKPGGYLLAFGGTRTYHRIACAVEDAGFEIRDCIMWLYGSGFPKSMNIGLAVDKKLGVDNRTGKVAIGAGNNNTVSMNSGVKKNSELKHEYEERKAQNEWKGWGTALKPSYEPIIVARKPFKGSLVDNVIKNGVGGLNIDECRVGDEELHNSYAGNKNSGFTSGDERDDKGKGMFSGIKKGETVVLGRFPANTILTYDENDFEEVCGGFPQTKGTKTNSKLLDIRGNNYNNSHKTLDIFYERGYDDSGSAARYFYCAKASKKDRDEGLEEFEEKNTMCDRNPELASANMLQNRSGNLRKNTHPTVKPTSLMQYLIRLVAPKGATILDPFMGSGSTGKAVMYENKERNAGYKFIGIEKDAEYCKIAEARIKNAELEK